MYFKYQLCCSNVGMRLHFVLEMHRALNISNKSKHKIAPAYIITDFHVKTKANNPISRNSHPLATAK